MPLLSKHEHQAKIYSLAVTEERLSKMEILFRSTDTGREQGQ